MTEHYITRSLETHLFFARIMKEHALFLEAGFVCMNIDWIQKADYFRAQFEDLLSDVVKISNGRVHSHILHSNELVTEFTIPAENGTERLSGVPIDSDITRMTHSLRSGSRRDNNSDIFRMVHQINERSICLLDGLIDFKECILKEMSAGNLFTFNYPLLIEHILREAKLYRTAIDSLMHDRQISYRSLLGSEAFWNQIMMEHAWFIRGLLDPSEEALIKIAHDFAMDYKKLLELAKQQDCIATQELTGKTLEKTLKYRDFKATGTKGILNCDIASIIVPLLADHVLREANHYIRILRGTNKWDSM